MTFLPDASPAVDIVAVPTTLGTSSETNSVGILKHDSGYRLIVGRSLRPRHAIIDPCNLMTLTVASVREGALEAFLRLAGASTSSRRSARGETTRSHWEVHFSRRPPVTWPMPTHACVSPV